MTTQDGLLPEKLRTDLLAAGFVTREGNPDRERFAEVYAKAAKVPLATARRYAYRWTELNNKPAKTLQLHTAKIVARLLKTHPDRYIIDAETPSGLLELRAELHALEARVRELEGE